MDTLPSEIVNEIILLIDEASLWDISQVCVLWRRLSLARVNSINSRADLVRACRSGNYLSITQSVFNKDWVNLGLENACSMGHKHIIQLMIAKGADHWNNAVLGACEGGHIDIVESMITKSFSRSRENNHQSYLDLCLENFDEDPDSYFQPYDPNRNPNKMMRSVFGLRPMMITRTKMMILIGA